MSGESVKVAVRVRPFNDREKNRQATCIIKMKGSATSIRNPASKEEPKNFAFDFSYWSHDGFQVDKNGVSEPAGGSNYASQRKVFNDLGQGVLDNAFQGYNCSLFAYGQTGSGKSYSMVGYGPNKGIVPITCDELFKTMGTNKDKNKRFEVTFSMLEIYNEQVRDLLTKDNPKGGLPVRQNPKLGLFYVQGLKNVPVGSYEEIERRTEQGTANRTVASTQMNATSSRAHTVVTIVFDQIIKNDGGSETKKSSVINLVDLAGSERAESTGATGDRLKEGANINKSLSALGNVISALADQSMGKKKVMVPYRDSVLTKLLQNALGGNSKTIMIAALSPADINYDETLSTLRYADRAKKIKNKAIVNENPMEKLIRELKEENDRLKKAMDGGQLPAPSGTQGLSPEEVEKMRKEMEEEIRAQFMANQEQMASATGQQSWEEKLQEARTDIGSDDRDRKKEDAHIVNLNEDPLLSGVVCHFLSNGETTVGRKDATPAPNITLSGLSIMKNHAVITSSKGEFEIRPAMTGAKTKVNGAPLTGAQTLEHKDRILFGSNHLYVFMNPKKPQASGDVPDEITWEFAQKEIAQAKGFSTGGGAGLTKDQQIAQEQVLEMLPLVSEMNAISEELNKHRSFEVVLISGAAQEGTYGANQGTKVMVKMKNLLNGNSWLWERGKFMNRRFLIQDMYQRFLDGEDVSKIKTDEDPFWEPTEDVLIGSSNVYLQSLAYALDFDDRIAITDYKGAEEGQLYVNVAPCHQNGKPLDEDYFVDTPEELCGKPYHFKVTVRSAEVNKARFSRGLRVKYRVFKDENYNETPVIKGSLSPEFNHSKVITFNNMTDEHIEFFMSGAITFLVYGLQEDTTPDAKLSKMTTKELRQMEQIQGAAGINRRNTSFGLDTSNDQSQLKSEYMLLMRKYERLLSKEKRMQELCKTWEEKPDGEKQFTPFYNAVSAVANSSGTKLKTRVQVLNKILRGQKMLQMLREENGDNKTKKGSKKPKDDGDTVSLFVFGLDEDKLAKEANENDGLVNYEYLAKEHYSDADLHMLAAHKSGSQIKGKDGGDKQGSKACVIQ